MDITRLDWNDVAVFLAIAETGSLSGAARKMSSSQPTMGRHLKRIEARLGHELFRRVTRGLELTDAGNLLLDPARAMQGAMQQFEMIAAGQDMGLRGTVKLTASHFVSHHILPSLLADMRRDLRDVKIDLMPSDLSENLLFREADIAVRMYRSTQLDVVTRHLGDIPLGIFGAKSYLDRRGRPGDLEAFKRHDLVGYDRDDRIIRGLRAAGWPVTRDDFAVRCDDQVTYWELVRRGCGLGFCQAHIGRADPLVEQVLPEIPIPPLPVWLAAPETIRRTPRVRAVWDYLATGLTGVLFKSG